MEPFILAFISQDKQYEAQVGNDTRKMTKLYLMNQDFAAMPVQSTALSAP
jgi:hypothetical protein